MILLIFLVFLYNCGKTLERVFYKFYDGPIAYKNDLAFIELDFKYGVSEFPILIKTIDGNKVKGLNDPFKDPQIHFFAIKPGEHAVTVTYGMGWGHGAGVYSIAPLSITFTAYKGKVYTVVANINRSILRWNPKIIEIPVDFRTFPPGPNNTYIKS